MTAADTGSRPATGLDPVALPPDTGTGSATASTAPAPAPSGSPLIRLRDITRRYGEGSTQFLALRGISLDVHDGEFVAVMGPSGSGKSTAMNILGCLDTASGGDYRFKGAPVQAMNRDQRALLRRRWLGFVFQGFNLLARTSAQENVELPLLYRGESASTRRAAARAALAEVGLAGWEHHTPGELSGGQQQRVAIARAIVTQPAVLLADEPTGNLDSARSVEIMQLLSRLNRERGITVLMVTHEPDMAAWAHRVLRFVDGRIASDRRQTPITEPPPAEADDRADDAPVATPAGTAGVAGVTPSAPSPALTGRPAAPLPPPPAATAAPGPTA